MAGNSPEVKLLPGTHKRQPYPLDGDEQTRLFQRLPDRLAQMALFAVNTGCRDTEICNLRWDWEVKLRAMNTSVFIIPGSFVKNGDERLVVKQVKRSSCSCAAGVNGRNVRISMVRSAIGMIIWDADESEIHQAQTRARTRERGHRKLPRRRQVVKTT